MSLQIRHLQQVLVILMLCLAARGSKAQTRTIRVVTYNIEDDTDGNTAPLPGLIAPPGGTVQQGGVLEGIGEEILGHDPAQPLDVLALEETTSNSSTVAPIVNGLNAFYGVSNMYAMSAYQATDSGGATSGGGPSALVYNSKTLQLLASIPVNPPSGQSLGSNSGEYRQVIRYEFAPMGVTATSTNEFYIYVSHYKSGSTATDAVSRGQEAAIIRNDEATNLPAKARVLYVGDYNVNNSGEVGYQTILSNTAPDGISQGGGIDAMNPTNNLNIDWSDSTTNVNILILLSEHGYNLEYRDDLQLMTTNVYYGTAGGLALVTNTYHVFGNNGTTAYGQAVTNGLDTAFGSDLVTNGPVFINASQLYTDLANASDHLPVVADYTLPLNIPAPGISAINVSGSNVLVTVTNAMASFTYTLLSSTNLNLPRINWTAAAAYTPGVNGSFSFTLTNPIAAQDYFTVAVH